ncbi:hypothetical protein LINGRAHAP2_LOCUS34780 [Linum grandiflorum]
MAFPFLSDVLGCRTRQSAVRCHSDANLSSSLTSAAHFSCVFLHPSSYLFSPVVDLSKLNPSFFVPCFCVTFRLGNLRRNSVSVSATFGSTVIRPSRRNGLDRCKGMTYPFIMPSFCFPFVVVDSDPSHLCWQGTRIQGDTLRPFAEYLESNVSVGSVYAITGFTLQPPRPTYRACRFPHWLALGPTPDTASAFVPESYEFVPFAKFPGRLPPCPYLTDFIVKVIALGKPNHVSRGSGVAPVHTVVVVDGR